MVPHIDKGGHGIAHFRGIVDRAVVISSGDVYRAFARLWKSEPGPPDRVPLTEESPLRTLPAPDGKGEDDFDNLDAERAALADPSLPATVLRLPATHGPGDRQHRLAPYLRAMHDDRPAIVLGSTHARWRWSRGYVENVAAAIALAVADERASGRTYNVAAEPAASEADWIRAIATITGWVGTIRVVPDDHLPPGASTALRLHPAPGARYGEDPSRARIRRDPRRGRGVAPHDRVGVDDAAPSARSSTRLRRGRRSSATSRRVTFPHTGPGDLPGAITPLTADS
jgi:nucleoside-diphosphate-sugar epimerase